MRFWGEVEMHQNNIHRSNILLGGRGANNIHIMIKCPPFVMAFLGSFYWWGGGLYNRIKWKSYIYIQGEK